MSTQQTPSPASRVLNALQLLFGGGQQQPAPAPAAQSVAVEPHWEPAFERPLGISLTPPGTYRNPYQNPEYFATRETAEWLMRRFGAREVIEAPPIGMGGPFLIVDATLWPSEISDNTEAYRQAAAKHGDKIILAERWLNWGNGFVFNAGQLGRFWKTYPDTMAPGAAAFWANQELAAARARGTTSEYEYLVRSGAIREGQ